MPRPDPVLPTLTKDGAEMHPSYATARVGRVSGSCNLNGTYAPELMSSGYIALTISKARRLNPGVVGEERWDPFEEIIEIAMTPMQWAELVSMSPSYSGVPVTLTHTRDASGKHTLVPEVPWEHTPSFEKRVDKDFAKARTELVRKLEAQIEGIVPLIKDRVPAKVLAQVEGRLEAYRTELFSNLPFFTKLVSEETEKVVQAAKTEVSSFIQFAVSAVGLKALRDGTTTVDAALYEANRAPALTDKEGE